ncbi:hypothetical protein Tco_0970396 [Tanacetum coccineum]
MEALPSTVTGESKPLFYNYLRPLTSLDEGLYALACEENVHCLATLVRSFKLIEVYIEHGVTALYSYLRAPWFRATIEELTDEPGSIASNRTEKLCPLQGSPGSNDYVPLTGVPSKDHRAVVNMYPSQVSPPRTTGQNCICTSRALTCNYQFNPLKLIRNHMSENKDVAFITENKYRISPRDMRKSMEFNQVNALVIMYANEL